MKMPFDGFLDATQSAMIQDKLVNKLMLDTFLSIASYKHDRKLMIEFSEKGPSALLRAQAAKIYRPDLADLAIAKLDAFTVTHTPMPNYEALWNWECVSRRSTFELLATGKL